MGDELLPLALGSPRRSQLARDFADCQLEGTTLPYSSAKEVLDHAQAILTFASATLVREETGRALDVLSMPAGRFDPSQLRVAFSEIPLEDARSDAEYRRALWKSYGCMQFRDAVHLNVSLSEQLLRGLAQADGRSVESDDDFKTFSNECHMSIARGLMEYSWLPVYLFGASVSYDDSVVDSWNPRHLGTDAVRKSEAWFFPSACSIKNYSDIAYRNKDSLELPFNSWEEYQSRLQHLIDSGVIQRASENYDLVRPRHPSDEQSVISHVESRFFEPDPFSPSLINQHAIALHDLLAVYFAVNPPGEIDRTIISSNLDNVSLRGRDAACTVLVGTERKNIEDAANEFLQKLTVYAEARDTATNTDIYTAAVNWARSAAKDPNETISGQIWQRGHSAESHIQLGSELATLRQSGWRPELVEGDLFSQKVEAATGSLKDLEDDLRNAGELAGAWPRKIAAARESLGSW